MGDDGGVSMQCPQCWIEFPFPFQFWFSFLCYLSAFPLKGGPVIHTWFGHLGCKSFCLLLTVHLQQSHVHEESEILGDLRGLYWIMKTEQHTILMFTLYTCTQWYILYYMYTQWSIIYETYKCNIKTHRAVFKSTLWLCSGAQCGNDPQAPATSFQRGSRIRGYQGGAFGWVKRITETKHELELVPGAIMCHSTCDNCFWKRTNLPKLDFIASSEKK